MSTTADAPRHDLKVRQFADFYTTVTYSVRNSAGTVLDLPVTYTGARLQIRTTPDAASTVADLDSSTPGEIAFTATATALIIELHIDKTVTALMTQRTYRYDLLIDDSNDNTRRILQGKVFVSPGVTAP